MNTVIDSRLATNVLHLRDDVPLERTSLLNSQTYYGGLTLYDRGTRREVAEAVGRLQPDLPYLGGAGEPDPTRMAQKFAIVGMMSSLIVKNESDTGTAYIDLYYWRAKRDVPYEEFRGIDNIWSSGWVYNIANAPTTGSVLVGTDLGSTPWGNPAFRKFVDIRMKRRIRLNAQSSTELSLRTSENFYNSGEYFQDQKSLIRGRTEGIFLVYHGEPYIDTAGGGGIQARPQTLLFSRRRTIYYKVLQNSLRTAGEAFNTGT